MNPFSTLKTTQLHSFLRARNATRVGVAIAAVCLLASCASPPNTQARIDNAVLPDDAFLHAAQAAPLKSATKISPRQKLALKIVQAARSQVGDIYDASYQTLSYPNGDVARGRGACTDVIVRALRAANYDLQKLIREDKRRRPQAYPARWRNQRSDANIDHRRVPNQVVFFKRFGRTLSNQTDKSTRAQWQAGDIVAWKFENDLDHIGIISDKTNAQGWPLVIHNVGGCAENDVLNAWKIVGHYRFPR